MLHTVLCSREDILSSVFLFIYGNYKKEVPVVSVSFSIVF